jgi:hypothetical protein
MTTIAWDGHTLAADTCAVMDGTILQYEQDKIFHPTENCYWEVFGKRILAMGFAGGLENVEWVKDSLQEGITHKYRVTSEAVELDFHVILVTESREVFAWAVTRYPDQDLDYNSLIPVNGPFAVGSGAVFAFSVMTVGNDAVAAVGSAALLDPYTSAPIATWEHPGKPKVLSTRPTKDV